jgi:hypothetical protein
MTLHEFSNELRRLHCIEGWLVPSVSRESHSKLALDCR